MRTTHIVVILILLAAGLLPSPAQAGGLVTVCDEAHLRAALAGAGMVTFACSGTITLTNTITIDGNTTIDGSGQDVTFSGNNALRVLSVGVGGTLNLDQLTIANGKADFGGGIRSDGTLTVSNSIFEDNNADLYGGGIYVNGGRATVSNSAFSGNHSALSSGGLHSLNGTLIVNNSAFSGNSAHDQGGGIFANGGTLTVSDSTFSDNSANWGGGIFNMGGVRMTVSNSTFTGNRAGGGAGICSFLGGTLTVSNSTFFGNIAEPGAAIYAGGGTLTVSNSTFSGNGSPSLGSSTVYNAYGADLLKNTIIVKGGGRRSCVGVFTDGGGNLSFPDDSCFGIIADPLLGPLQNNGGPTWTMAPGPGSPAIDAGNDAVCFKAPVNSLDQRGVMRPVGSHCDSGAVEVNYLPIRTWLPTVLAGP